MLGKKRNGAFESFLKVMCALKDLVSFDLHLCGQPFRDGVREEVLGGQTLSKCRQRVKQAEFLRTTPV